MKVFYAPNMKNNILNLGQLLEKGFDIHMKNLSLNLRDKNYIDHIYQNDQG